MNLGRYSIFRRGMGQDFRAWPMLALLVLVVVTAIGCVAWFMREAIRNERLAVQGKLTQLYQAQLELMRDRTVEEWTRHEMWRPVDSGESAAIFFARAVRESWADSVLVFDGEARVLYPQMDGEGRVAAANARLLELEKNPADPALAAELQEWLNDYTSPLPAAQRRFLMREVQRLVPAAQFATLAAEDLAAQYLEANRTPHPTSGLRASNLPGVWEAGSTDGRTLTLFQMESIREKLAALNLRYRLENGLRVKVGTPGEETAGESNIATVTLAPVFPGWKLWLESEDPSLASNLVQQRVTAHLWIGSAVIAALLVLGFFAAQHLSRQMRLARLKNDLVATVSHELKTPLTAMRALVETLLDAERLEEKTTREYLGMLAAENSRLSRLIDNFLTFSRLERNRFAFDFTRLAPQEVVADAVAAMGERRHAIETTVPSSLPAIRGDAGALVTALLNLLDNAWKYSGADKRITVRAGAENGHVHIAVEDHGVGLSACERRRIFDQFYRGDERLTRTVGGCGLGLSIVRSIVTAHHGTVQVVSEVGRGSTFTIELPAAS